jgi:penicillin-binding protein 1C
MIASVRGRIFAAAACIAGSVVLGTAGWVMAPLPRALITPPDSAGVRIEDRHAIVLRSTRAADGSRARWVSLDEMDPDLLLAFIAVEDARFWDHGGIDPLAVARAARDNLRARRIVSGASTITMQLARLLRPGSRGWGSKAGEAFWALRLEHHLTKQQVLEQYLNRVQLGQAAIGVGAASSLYFGAAASEISVGEAAMLAGLAHAPSRDNPLVSPKRASARRAVAIVRMRRASAITGDEAERARSEPIVRRRSDAPFLAPHFTSRLLQQPTASGAIVHTTLDAALQRELEDETHHAVEMLAGRQVHHAAVVVLDNRSGDVLAWVGSPDFWAPENGQTDMVISPRQPGSALKPFLYALAFDRGLTAATVIPDVPRSYATASGPYQPRNYDRRFRGPVRIREALASSYNVPAIDVAERMGTGALLRTLQLAGFQSLQRDADHYGLGLALGNGDVTLLELANGYRGLSNGGVWTPYRWLTDERAGERSRAASSDSGTTRRFASAQAAAIVLDILSDPSARVPGFGLETPFDFPFPTAVKTGTSRHFTDNWAVATTGGFTVGVWVGNFSGQPMEGVSGVSGAGPLLHRAVMLTAQRYSPGALTTPASAGLVGADVCRLSGMRATSGCPAIREWFIAGSEPRLFDTWMRAGRAVLPAEYAEWAAAEGQSVASAGDAPDAPAADTDGGDAPVALTGFRIVAPLDGDVYRVPPGVPTSYATIPFIVAGGSGPVRWYVDDVPHEGARWRLARGAHVIRAESPTGALAVRIRVE